MPLNRGMTTHPRVAAVVLASAAAAAILAAAALITPWAAAVVAALVAGAVGGAVLQARRPVSRTAEPARAADPAGTLAIHDAATGLHAEWYLRLRAHEELRRFSRRRFPLSVVSLWCSDEPPFLRLAGTLRARLRAGDLAAPFGHLHIVCLLPGTSAIGAMGMVARALAEAGVHAQVGIAQARDADDTLRDLLDRAREGRTSFGPAAPRLSLIRRAAGDSRANRAD